MDSLSSSIELQGVSKTYGNALVIDNVNLSVAPGECLVLIGHNGSGKTTLMKLLLGLIRPSAGQVRVFGEDPTSASSVARRGFVGYLPESIAFDPAMSGRELLNFYAALKGVNKRSCEALLARVGIADAADRRISTWSKGMRQRLGLAQAMLGEPRLMLLDEPTSGLDPSLRRTFYEIIGSLLADGVTVLISSHSLNEVEEHADRVGIIKQGSMPAFGTLAELSMQADLPVTVRITCAPGAAQTIVDRLTERLNGLNEHVHEQGLNETGRANISQIDDQHLELACAQPDKMAVLREVVALGDNVIDVDVRLPRLDEIYAHFMPPALSGGSAEKVPEQVPGDAAP
jgi:Cu-processing system ATP-binding protein